jgi:heme O synthase-like polyprenyltransferase
MMRTRDSGFDGAASAVGGSAAGAVMVVVGWASVGWRAERG